MIAINMPVIGQDIPTGVIVEWYKQEGDRVEKDEVIAVVESEKAAFDVESPDSGTILKLVYSVGDEVEVLTPIAYLGSENEIQITDVVESANTSDSKQSVQKIDNGSQIVKPVEENGKMIASPLARKVAKEKGVSLMDLEGTGPGGRIIKKNVLNHLELNKSEKIGDELAVVPAEEIDLRYGESIPLTNLQKIVAEKLSYSKQNIPHFYLSMDVDMDNALNWRKSINDQSSAKVSINDLITYACSRALTEFTRLNAHFVDNAIILNRKVNIGIAADTEKGLMVPVLADVSNLDILKIAEKTRKIVENSRGGKLDLSVKGTFTISSLGMFGIREFLPIINPPEAAILAVGKVEETVKVNNGQFGMIKMVRLNLACDHRIVDGVYGAKFLNAVKKYLEVADFKIFI